MKPPIVRIDQAQAAEIIEQREPLGLFYLIDGNCYIGIDNSTGDAWTEEFPTLRRCKKWLLNPSTHLK